MKRFLAVLLSVLLMMTSLPMVMAQSVELPEGPCFVVNAAAGKRGETVKVEISAIRNPGIVSVKVRVHFDADVLKLVGYEEGNFSATGYSWGNDAKVPFIINWCDATKPDNTADLLATLSFEILDDAAYGASNITIEFSCEDDVYNYDWETVEFSPVHGGVYVLYPVTGVELNQTVLDIHNGDTANLTATVLAEGQTDQRVVWESDNTNVVTVDENGVVTAVALGCAKVTVTTVEGGFAASCVVNVTCAHRNTTEVAAVESTCVVPGNAAYTRCDDCGEIIVGSDAALPLAGHNYNAVVTAPDCENSGYTIHTCTVCGDNYADGRVDPLGHDYVLTEEVAPTCVAAGKKVYVCATCGDGYTETLDATGKHTYEHGCDETCNVCGYVRDDAHEYIHQGTVEPTCGEDGYDFYKCWGLWCGNPYISVPIPATGNHKYSGMCDAECNVCGRVRESVESHNYVLTDAVETTCVTDGSRTYTCSGCGDSYTLVDTAPGHQYRIVITAPDCVNGGYTTHTCSACGHSIVDNRVDALGHAYNAVVTAPTCGEDGYTTHTCANCGDSYVDSPVPATGEHTYDNHKDAECNECGHVRSLPGDVNSDKKVNNRDLGVMQLYLNNADVDIDTEAADLNGDNKVNNRDLGLLQRLLNGWDINLK